MRCLVYMINIIDRLVQSLFLDGQHRLGCILNRSTRKTLDFWMEIFFGRWMPFLFALLTVAKYKRKDDHSVKNE